MDQLMTTLLPRCEVQRGPTARSSRSRAITRGRATCRRCARKPRKRGLDPDQWFNNVEIVTAEKIGMETTTYVRNIYKYYVAYKLMQEAQATQRKARAQVAPSAP